MIANRGFELVRDRGEPLGKRRLRGGVRNAVSDVDVPVSVPRDDAVTTTVSSRVDPEDGRGVVHGGLVQGVGIPRGVSRGAFSIASSAISIKQARHPSAQLFRASNAGWSRGREIHVATANRRSHRVQSFRARGHQTASTRPVRLTA
jgi:hypothetical protein